MGNDKNIDFDHERRISTMEGVLQTFMTTNNTALGEIKGMLNAGIEQRSHMIGRLALIDKGIADGQKYQENCDTERKTLTKDVAKVKNFQGNQKKIAASISALICLAFESPDIVKKIMGWFA